MKVNSTPIPWLWAMAKDHRIITAELATGELTSTQDNFLTGRLRVQLRGAAWEQAY